MRTRSRSVCFVVGEERHLTAGEGASDAPVKELRDRGWTVHALFCGEPGRESSSAIRRLQAAGVQVHHLDRSRSPGGFRVQNLYDPAHIDHTDHVRHALDRLHREYRFDLIEFGVQGGLGFRAVQAKRAGLAFDDVVLAARLDSCGHYLREREERWTSGLDELERDYAERYSFENADARFLSSVELANFVRDLGWAVPDSAQPPGQAGWANRYEQTFADVRTASADDGERPLVTVGLTHYNLGQYLPAALASLAAQTYPRIEVVVVDDGSTDPQSVEALEEARARYPEFRFIRQPNAGAGAARNRCLAEARGEYFIPVDADNVTRPDMVERFVHAIRRNPHLSVMTCYFLAFAEADRVPRGSFLYAVRPAGGPHTMASIRNVYGDTNAIYRTKDFREVGGYEVDRGTTNEDWEAFVKLVHAGKRIGVIPDHLFYYRHRPAGFSRTTNSWFANHQRVLRQFTRHSHLPPGESAALWAALLGFQQQVEQLTSRQQCLRYRIADRLHALCSYLPGALRGGKRTAQLVRGSWRRLARIVRSPWRRDDGEKVGVVLEAVRLTPGTTGRGRRLPAATHSPNS